MGLSRELVFKLAKGFRGRSKNCWRLARLRVEKALTRSFEGRKLKKREHRGIWIVRINAGAREHGVSGAGEGRWGVQQAGRVGGVCALAWWAMHGARCYKWAA